MDSLIDNLVTVEDMYLALGDTKVPKKVKEQIKKLKVLQVTLALKPTDGIIDIISSFLKKNLREKVLIDFSIDENIIGGTQFIYKGKYGNYAVSKNI